VIGSRVVRAVIVSASHYAPGRVADVADVDEPDFPSAEGFPRSGL